MFRLMTIEIPAQSLVDYGIIPSLPPSEKVAIVSVLRIKPDSVEMICRVSGLIEGDPALEENFRNADVTLLSSAEGEDTYYVKYKVPPLIVDVLTNFDLYIHYPIMYARGRFLISFIGRSEKLDAFVRSMGSRGAEFTLVSVKSYMPDEMNVGLLSGLTPSQKKILAIATQSGYFDHPRRTDTRQLAMIAGLKPSTVAEHIRRGEYKIFSRLFSPYIETS